MASNSLIRLLDRLDELKRSFGDADEVRIDKVLSNISKRRFRDAPSLIRFHEALLFIRAYPHSPRVLRTVERMLATFSQRVSLILGAAEGVEVFSDPEVSGIVSTSLTAIFSYPVIRWLAERHPADVSIDFDGYEDAARLGQTLPLFIPLLEDESLVEANVAYVDWIRVARNKGSSAISWLMRCFERLDLSDKRKSELYDSLQLYIHWKPRGFRISRTGMRLNKRNPIYQNVPLISRRDISLGSELVSPSLPVEKLSRREGEELLGLIRDTSAIRYRELHGFTHGDPKHVVRADAGRGVEFFLNGVGSINRLPLRAYHSVFMVKNGVPIGYVEGLSLFERMEIGFNIYYTFRDGESAWLYAKILRLFRQLLGVTVFSVDPYQIGFENKEGIDSGAFWFYRKLGFRPVKSTIEKLVHSEEKKISARSGYRTSPSRLRQIAEGHMLFEFEPEKPRLWDGFQVRNLGLAVARKMGARFQGDELKMRQMALNSVSHALSVNAMRWNDSEQHAFENLALVLSLIPNLSHWTMAEKKAIVDIIRAKSGIQESKYLHLLQKHNRLRDEIVRLGS